MMRYLIMLEQTESGFAVQVPDLAIVTHGATIEEAKRTAVKAITINLNAYQQEGKNVPKRKPASTHLKNPDFADVLFMYVEVKHPKERHPRKNVLVG